MSSITVSSAECSTWYAVSLTTAVAVVAVNLLSIILFVKNSNLRTRAMYLVINLTVVRYVCWRNCHFLCSISFSPLRLPSWKYIMALAGIATYYGCAFHDRGVAPSHLFSRYCSNFFRADACDVSSIQASQHQKMGLRGNNYRRLDFNCDDNNSPSVNKSLWELASTVAIAISFLLMAVILFPLPYCYLCFLHLHCFKILVWNSSSVPWCGQ